MTTNSTQKDIEALADSLSASADALHTRLMSALRQQPPAVAQPVAQTLFENEVALRQRANGLYLEAAVLAAGGLGGTQKQLLDVTARAQDKIRKIEHVKDLIQLTGELLSLAAAIAAGKPDRLAEPYENIKHHLEAMGAK